MLTDPITPTALVFAALTFALDRLVVFMRRRTRSQWRRLQNAIAIGVNAAWHAYVRDLKTKGNPTPSKLNDTQIMEAQNIALSVAEAHAKRTCPKLWRKVSDAEKSYLIDQALRRRKVKVQESTRKNSEDTP